MKKLTILVTIFILSQIFTANVCLGNSTNQTSFLSGSAWVDNNDNGTQDLDEKNTADVIVFIKSVETEKMFTAKTDASGFFTLAELPYGHYNVWSENSKGMATPNQLIELNEVNAANLLDFMFTPAETTALPFSIFLPIVNN